MFKILASFFSAFALLWIGLFAGLWWEAGRPAGWPSYTFALGPFHHTFHVADGTGARLAALQEQVKRAGVHNAAVVRAQASISVMAGAAEDVAQARIATNTKARIKRIPDYVSAEADARCRVPAGFVRLHDAAVRGSELPSLSPSAAEPNDAGSGVDLSAIAETVVANYGLAEANAEQLTALQSWIRQEAAASTKTAP